MSILVFSWVLHHSPATLGARLVLLVLAEHAHNDGTEAYPKIDVIAHETRLSERQVRRALDKLVEMGAIEETGKRRNGRTRCWRVVMRTSVHPDPDILSPALKEEPSVNRPAPQSPKTSSSPTEGASASRTPRKRDLHWEALARAMGREPLTNSERGAWNAALKQLKDAGATPEQIEVGMARYEREWPEAELTPTAFARHASRFLALKVEDLGDGWVRIDGALHRKED